MVGAALAFCAGVALATGGPAWCGALLGLLLLLRPLQPFRRPNHRVMVVAALVAAGWAHGAAAGHEPAPPAAPPPAAGAEAESVPGAKETIRERLTAGIRRTFPSEAPMVEALLLAERRGLDPGVRTAFTRSGAAHLLAISGFHVGILAGWVVLLLRLLRLGRVQSAAAATAAVWGYVAFLGFPTSAVRAALLLSGAAVGRLRGRPAHSLGAWGTALLVVAVWSPATLRRAGTQLSFAGALGLMLWAGPWTRGLLEAARRRIPALASAGVRGEAPMWLRAVAGAVAASAAAQVATLPIAVWHFQRVAVLALPVTLVATPLVSFALPGALLALGASALGLPGWPLLAQGVEALLHATGWVVAGLAVWDPGWLLGPGPVTLSALAAAAVWAGGRGRIPRRRRWMWAAAAAGVALPVAPLAREWVRSPALEIRILDVGQGDAIAVGTPAGRWFLVDTGAGSGDRLARTLVSHGVRRLELLVLTHPDLDHMGAAAELVRTLPVGAVADGGVVRPTDAYREVLAAAREEEVPWRVLERDQSWELDGVRIEVLHPEAGRGGDHREPNEASVVLLVRWGAFDALLTGDVSVAVEEEILSRLTPVEVLKVGHHGSRTSTGDRLLDRVRPQLSVISVGRRNRFGHPAPEVLARLRDRGGRVVRTDLDGSVVIRGREDGSWTLATERPGGD